MSLELILAAGALCAFSGVPAIFFGRSSNKGQVVAAFFSVAGSLIGLAGVVFFFSSFVSGETPPAFSSPWAVPGGSFSAAVDGLSALFLIPVFLISGLGAVYGVAYWPQSANPQNGRKLRFYYALLVGGMVLLVVARNSILFLAGWEAMALSAYFLVTTEDQVKSAREAGWTYLVATHFGTLGLLALFALMRSVSGTFDWAPFTAGSLGAGLASTLFILTILGFGVKAGIMPFHVWLPGAHASAPSHVSGLMSGVMIKMGIYGVIRVCGYLPAPPLWWGMLILGMGALSGVIGVASAIGQSDLKRVLAYSSIENVGIIFLGIGLAMIGRAIGNAELVALGLGGALFHVLNHSLFKSLLFFSAGSVIHGTGTRTMDLLGGLAKSMPATALAFAVGASAICGLPILNGFAGELLLYLGLFKAALSDSKGVSLVAAVAASVLALIGALSVACFVRAFGSVFLGVGRSDQARHAHEAGRPMTAVLATLAVLCLLVGVAPWALAPLLDRSLAGWLVDIPGPAPALSEIAPLREIGACAISAALAIALLIALSNARLNALGKGCAAAFVRWRGRPAETKPVAPQGTWSCGYADPSSPRIQYTASSFGDFLAGLFRWALKRTASPPPSLKLFPAAAKFETRALEPLLGNVLTPFFRRWAERFSRLRILQQGQIQIYLVYILIMLVLLMAWATLDTWIRS